MCTWNRKKVAVSWLETIQPFWSSRHRRLREPMSGMSGSTGSGNTRSGTYDSWLRPFFAWWTLNAWWLMIFSPLVKKLHQEHGWTWMNMDEHGWTWRFFQQKRSRYHTWDRTYITHKWWVFDASVWRPFFFEHQIHQIEHGCPKSGTPGRLEEHPKSGR